MDARRRCLAGTVVGYLITAGMIVGVPLAIVPQDARSDLFWHRIVATECLALLVWAAFGFYVTFATARRATGGGLGGVLPVAVVAITVHSLVAFILMMAHAYAPESDLTNRTYLALQIVVAGVAATFIVLLHFVRTGATAGTEPLPPDVKTPQQLRSALEYQEGHLKTIEQGGADTTGLLAALQTLRENISHSLPGAGAIGGLEEYRTFSADINELCTTLDEIGRDKADTGDIQSVANRARELTERVALLSATVKR